MYAWHQPLCCTMYFTRPTRIITAIYSLAPLYILWTVTCVWLSFIPIPLQVSLFLCMCVYVGNNVKLHFGPFTFTWQHNRTGYDRIGVQHTPISLHLQTKLMIIIDNNILASVNIVRLNGSTYIQRTHIHIHTAAFVEFSGWNNTENKIQPCSIIINSNADNNDDEPKCRI